MDTVKVTSVVAGEEIESPVMNPNAAAAYIGLECASRLLLGRASLGRDLGGAGVGGGLDPALTRR